MTAEEWTAVGTFVLAGGTAWLGLSTRKLAREANAERRANWQPILLPDVGGASEGGGLWLKDRVLWMRVRNVGRGPALNVTVALWDESEPLDSRRTFRARSTSNVVAPDERVTFEWRDFDAPKPDVSIGGLQAWAPLTGMITYDDAGYSPYETEIKVGFRIDGAVALYDHRFLGARRDRVRTRDRVRYRAFLGALALERRAPQPVARLARMVARRSLKRLS